MFVPKVVLLVPLLLVLHVLLVPLALVLLVVLVLLVLVIKYLRLMCTSRSIDMTRRVKSVKQEILTLTKKRNQIWDPIGVTLFRGRGNLKQIMKTEENPGKKNK